VKNSRLNNVKNILSLPNCVNLVGDINESGKYDKTKISPSNITNRYWRNNIAFKISREINSYHKKTIIQDSSAVSNIVTSIMMLGIFLSILAMVFTVYIPSWAKSGEANHMEQVMDSILDLKSSIDKQVADESGVGSTISTRVKLGAEGGSIMGIGRTSGSLSMKTTEFNISVYNTNDTQNLYDQTYGKISFRSRNIYFQNQIISYENGAVIVEQDGSAVMRAKPNFGVTYDDNKTTVVISLIQLSGGADNINGKDHHTIDSTLTQSFGQSHELIWSPAEGFDYGQNITINISTKYGELWRDFIDEELNDLPAGVRNNTVTLTMTQYRDLATGETYYVVLVTILSVDKLDLKKGIVDINLN
jgi:hypothetical protein